MTLSAGLKLYALRLSSHAMPGITESYHLELSCVGLRKPEPDVNELYQRPRRTAVDLKRTLSPPRYFPHQC